MPKHPQDPLESLQRQVERLFHDLVYHRHPSSHFAEPRWSPPADLVVSEHGARVILELAGVPREGVKVQLRGNVLEVSGRRDPPQESAGTHYHRAEIYFGDFHRLVELPWEADPAKVDAIYRDGMLEIRLRPAPLSQRTEVPIEEQGTS
ncbi:MAG: Hsp20/alpha crystallin family protein [Candidatus Eisenbacteria bacterium]|nr:Hsp20/alpha crystallin family protein [Candidatus Eisenbacteria bacterium]